MCILHDIVRRIESFKPGLDRAFASHHILPVERNICKLPFLLLMLLALPLIEIAVLIMVGSSIGVLATIGLILLTGVLGTILLRIQGLSALSRIRDEIDRGQTPDKSLADAAMIALAGLFLILPGFVSDVAGILLFLPPVRALIRSIIGKRVTIVRTSGRSGNATHPDVVDLDPAEFRRTGTGNDKPSPWQIPPKDKS
jgi:UPF0716 protein FxsA